MVRRLSLSLLIATFSASILATTAEAQLFGRRAANRDASSRELKEMEEYYDDLEDYYEDRNPQLAREAERMEKYYKNLRKGRRVLPPAVNLPRLQRFLDSNVRQTGLLERSVLVPQAGEPGRTVSQGQPRAGESRWQSWGATPPPAEVNEAEPTPQLAEVYRAPTDAAADSGGLRFPPTNGFDPQQRFRRSYAAFQNDLNQLAQESPNAARKWMEYLAVPTPDASQPDTSSFYIADPTRKSLDEALERFDSVAADPRYRAISSLGSFGNTRTTLRELTAWLEQQPTLATTTEPGENSVLRRPAEAEELPAPPVK